MFKLTIETGNAAFHDVTPSVEVVRILKDVIKKLESGEHEGSCRDLNGNRVGRFELTEE